MQKSSTPVTDLFFPRRCPVCDRAVKPAGALICRTCGKVPVRVRMNAGVCMKCGKPLADPSETYCRDCRGGRHLYTRGSAVFLYRSVSGGLYRFKYQGRQEYADYYVAEMADALTDRLGTVYPEAPDLLVPVPVHPDRLRKRGYNQAELLAAGIGKKTGIPVRADILQRTNRTPPMRSMSAGARAASLARSFFVSGNDVKSKKLIVIDDIYTTGATIDACAGALLGAGAAAVYFLTLAVGENG